LPTLWNEEITRYSKSSVGDRKCKREPAQMRRGFDSRSGGLQTTEAIRKSPFLEKLLLFSVAALAE